MGSNMLVREIYLHEIVEKAEKKKGHGLTA
jgi:hypothetical protein